MKKRIEQILPILMVISIALGIYMNWKQIQLMKVQKESALSGAEEEGGKVIEMKP